jgi:hypothetical protein
VLISNSLLDVRCWHVDLTPFELHMGGNIAGTTANTATIGDTTSSTDMSIPNTVGSSTGQPPLGVSGEEEDLVDV